MLENVLKLCNRLGEEKEKLKSLATDWKEFEEAKSVLLDHLEDVHAQVIASSVVEPTLEGTQGKVGAIKEAQAQVLGITQLYEEFRNLGGKLLAEDHSRQKETRAGLEEVLAKWEDVNELIVKEVSIAETVSDKWKHYEDAKQEVVKIFSEVEPTILENPELVSLQQIQARFDQLKVRFIY